MNKIFFLIISLVKWLFRFEFHFACFIVVHTHLCILFLIFVFIHQLNSLTVYIIGVRRVKEKILLKFANKVLYKARKGDAEKRKTKKNQTTTKSVRYNGCSCTVYDCKRYCNKSAINFEHALHKYFARMQTKENTNQFRSISSATSAGNARNWILKGKQH